MPINNRIASLADDAREWRHDLHRHPELQYDLDRTAGTVASRLREFGCDEVATGIGRTGVVAIIRGKGGGGGALGLRADMDALPITEVSGAPWASQSSGRMHACGHDGHTAMLLCAARYLCETRQFSGEAVMIFQPAEEGGAGAKAMIDDGLMERFEIASVFGMHNMPGLAPGQFAIRPGALMAAADRFTIEVEGRGGHAARPHFCVDPIAVGAAIVASLQHIVSRELDPLASCVVSVTQFHAGTTDNVIPQTAFLEGTVRALEAPVRDIAERRVGEIAAAIAAAHGASAIMRYERGYPVTRNHPAETALAAGVAREIAGTVNEETPPVMGAEDFSYMLESRPGAFIFVGNGDSAGLHNPAYDFNDGIIAAGASYWARLVETLLPLRGAAT